MKRSIALILAAGQLLLTGAAATAGGLNKVWTGRVLHVSTENIKVYSPTAHQALSFMLVPKFKQVFSDEGKTTAQMAQVHTGTRVRVYYDQKALGMRHADRIIILTPSGMAVKQVKS